MPGENVELLFFWGQFFAFIQNLWSRFEKKAVICKTLKIKNEKLPEDPAVSQNVKGF